LKADNWHIFVTAPQNLAALQHYGSGQLTLIPGTW